MYDSEKQHQIYLKYYKNNNCQDCGIIITKHAIRCNACARIYTLILGIKKPTGEKASNFRHGAYCKQHFCIDCKSLISIETALNGNHRCRKCAKIGKNHPNYIDGRTSKKNFCKDCKKEIDIKAIRCNKCDGIYQTQKGTFKGKNNGRFGKVPSHGKSSYYKNIFMRSSWEIAYAKYLDKNNIKWLYESKIFDLGDTTYTPDFYLPETDEYIEIKGWWRDKSKIKFDLFRQKYPKIKIIVITKKEYDILCKNFIIN